MLAFNRWLLIKAVCLWAIVLGQPAERMPSVDPNHYQPSTNPCYDSTGAPQRCVPDFINVAFNLNVDVTNTCGTSQPTRFCVQSGHMGHVGIRKVCDICDARVPAFAHPPSYLTDFNNPDNETWWQSDTMNEGTQYPNMVNLTINFEKAFDITYARLKFMSPRPESFIIYKKTTHDGEWIPWQYYSGSCKSTFKMPERAPILPGNEAVAQCTREFSDISPLTGGNIAYSTLDGRPSAENFEESEVLQEWVTAVAIRIVLYRMNTFGDEVFKDPKVLKSYYYAISDFAVGGRCKCNGHASNCVKSTGQGEQRLVCDCKHHTTGADCQQCEPFYQDRPWRAATSDEANECLPCDCNGLSQRCYFDQKLYDETGHGGHCIDCAGNTQGPHCENCTTNHWRRPGEHFCVACQCNEQGSISQQCNSEGQCECKPGVTGERCDQCKPGFYDFSPSGCKDCHCEAAGSWNNQPQCSPYSGDCQCKSNVEGQKCDKCKPGYFNLSLKNQYGCTPCFCYGHSSVCFAADGYYSINTTSHFLEGTDKWTGGSERRLEDVQWAQVDNAIAVSQLENDPVYFYAPSKFLGDQRLAYNQDLTFTLRVKDDRVYPSKKDIVLVGASGLELSVPIFAQQNPYPTSREQNYRFRIHADTQLQWQPNLREIDFIGVLSNLTAIKIRGTFSRGDVGYLSNFALGTASITPDSEAEDGSSPAEWVETCNCTEGFVGQFCESCAPGYRRAVKFGGPLTKCIKCDCHGHSDSCDAESGACICQHNTGGDTCETCARGYYGNALNGTETDCQKCDCPENGPCVLLNDGTTFCTECPTGYTGKKCDQCADEFFGNPEDGKPCEQCICNNNTDPNSIGNCDGFSGECKKCIYHTTGFNCEKCESGYWGDALAEVKGDCKPCSCYAPGTKRKNIEIDLLECQQDDGQCDCQPNVQGLRCDQCNPGFFNLTSGTGCQDCECDPLGSTNTTCNLVTGQCTCKPGVTGRKCDQCAERHFGFSAEGCEPCNCDVTGSEAPDCDVRSGQCLCRDNVEGRRCDQCSENRFNMRAGCLPCNDCYKLIQTRKNELNATIEILSENLDEIQNHPVSIDDPEFEKKLNEAKERVNELKKTTDEKLTKEDGRALARQVNDLRKGLEEAKVSVKDVDQKLKSFDGKASEIEAEVKRFKSDEQSVRGELDGAVQYVENEGRTHLKNAQVAAEKYGDNSQKMSEMAEEAKRIADAHDKQRNEVKETVEKTVNSSRNAAHEANDAIFGATRTSQQIAELQKLLDDTLLLLNQTKQLAEEEAQNAEKVHNDAARAVSNVQELKLPNIIPDSLKTESEQLKKDTAEAEANAQELIKNNEDTLESARAALAEARDVLQQAQRATNETEARLNEVKYATQRAQEAFENATSTWNEARETYETLSGFQDNIDNKKEEALKALEDFSSIKDDINTAVQTTREAETAIGNAKADAENALRIAEEALKDAEKAEQIATKLEEDLEATKKVTEDREKEFTTANEALDNLATTTQNFENQALSDKDKATEALKKATRAESNAKNLQQKLEDAEKKLTEASRQMNSLEDVNDDALEKLELLLAETEKNYEAATVGKQIKKEKDSRISQERDLLRRDVAYLQDELDNLKAVYESLPEKCFNQVSLEQEGQK
jgi:laminin gamma 1